MMTGEVSEVEVRVSDLDNGKSLCAEGLRQLARCAAAAAAWLEEQQWAP